MNPPKCEEFDYINFLIASPRPVSATFAASCQPAQDDPPAHDAFTRLLHRLEPDADQLWHEAKQLAQLDGGLLVVDDTVLDKPYARKIELVTRTWSGKHQQVVAGIDLITLLWTDGHSHIPCDYRIYDKQNDGLSKNDHFRAMLTAAQQRGFNPACVCFDSWYSSLDNLKLVRSYHWRWLTQLKRNRLADPDGLGNRPLSELDISNTGTLLHLKAYGWIKVFKLVTPNGDVEYWATNDVKLELEQIATVRQQEWAIETYHRGLKQHCGVERAMVRKARAQRNHIGLAIRAFLRLELERLRSGQSWMASKMGIMRAAVQSYLTRPLYTLVPTA